MPVFDLLLEPREAVEEGFVHRLGEVGEGGSDHRQVISKGPFAKGDSILDGCMIAADPDAQCCHLRMDIVEGAACDPVRQCLGQKAIVGQRSDGGGRVPGYDLLTRHLQ